MISTVALVLALHAAVRGPCPQVAPPPPAPPRLTIQPVGPPRDVRPWVPPAGKPKEK